MILINVAILPFSVAVVYLFFHRGDDMAFVVTYDHTPRTDGDLVVLAVVFQLSPLVEGAVLS